MKKQQLRTWKTPQVRQVRRCRTTGEQWFEVAVKLGDRMWGAGAHGDAICAPPRIDTEFSSAEGGNQDSRANGLLEILSKQRWREIND
jgi:hypothetical protein